MEKKKRQIEQVYYIAFDGSEFLKEAECDHYEKMKNGIRRNCPQCEGAGEITKDDDFAGDGKWGSPTGVSHWQEKCPNCRGKGYLEKKEIWN